MAVSNLFFVGDSISYGQLVSVEKTWVYMVANWLNRDEMKFIIQNSSIMGNTTREALQRLYNDALYRSASVIYYQFGMNDCNMWDTDKGLPRVSPKTFEANLEELISRARAYKAYVLLGTNHPSNKSSEYDERNKRYNEIIRSVCVNNNVGLIDHETYWHNINHLEYLLPDGIHLNEKGHKLYFENFIQKTTILL